MKKFIRLSIWETARYSEKIIVELIALNLDLSYTVADELHKLCWAAFVGEILLVEMILRTLESCKIAVPKCHKNLRHFFLSQKMVSKVKRMAFTVMIQSNCCNNVAWKSQMLVRKACLSGGAW